MAKKIFCEFVFPEIAFCICCILVEYMSGLSSRQEDKWHGRRRATIWDGNIAAVFASHFCICLTKSRLYLSSHPTFVFVSPNLICICLPINLWYLSDLTIFVFVFLLNFCICLTKPYINFVCLQFSIYMQI